MVGKHQGSIGRSLYNDFAIFYDDLINIKDVKFFINDEWTEYMSLEKAEFFLESL